MKRVISPLAVAMWVTAAFNALALDDATTNKLVSSAYNQTNGVAIKGYDPVAYQTDNKALKGDAKFSATHNGVMFHFAGSANRDLFIATPEKYAPQYGGYCAFGVTKGYKADINPNAFAIIDGKLYLNYDTKVQTMWRKNTAGSITIANSRWRDVEKTTNVIRQHD